ncbi:hypothetical protein ApDm4_2264 [Acetobacter pomorum]|nr:hypothetical protein ApDm4_2264 [Acetobacter pomorum]
MVIKYGRKAFSSAQVLDARGLKIMVTFSVFATRLSGKSA